MSVKIYLTFFCMKYVGTCIFVCHTKHLRLDVSDMLGFCAASAGSLLATLQYYIAVPFSEVKMSADAYAKTKHVSKQVCMLYYVSKEQGGETEQ
jgi:hypothetical protein